VRRRGGKGCTDNLRTVFAPAGDAARRLQKTKKGAMAGHHAFFMRVPFGGPYQAMRRLLPSTITLEPTGTELDTSTLRVEPSFMRTRTW
jgi:hypothetical protein